MDEMKLMDMATLLTPLTPASPCGDDLEYHADFIAMEQACTGKAEQQFGALLIPAEPADWDRVATLACSVLMRSKDLRAMLALTRAWTELQGLSGYARGLELITQSLQCYWQSLYPQLDGAGEEGARARLNVLAGLGDASMLTIRVRQLPFLHSATDDISLRDTCSLLDGSKADVPGYPGGRARLMEELIPVRQPNIAVLLIIDACLQRLRALLTDYLGESALPAMDRMMKTVATVSEVCRGREREPCSAPLAGADTKHASMPPVASERQPASVSDWRHSAIQSRSDALLMLEKVKMYFTEYEPGHPAPLMVDRVQRTIGLDFMAIIHELAPDGAAQLANLLGHRQR